MTTECTCFIVDLCLGIQQYQNTERLFSISPYATEIANIVTVTLVLHHIELLN